MSSNSENAEATWQISFKLFLTLTNRNSMVSASWTLMFGVCHEKVQWMHICTGTPPLELRFISTLFPIISPLWLYFLASAGCWCALLRASSVFRVLIVFPLRRAKTAKNEDYNKYRDSWILARVQL
jgi:hypothetical protein